jgi:tetratricopeptide (TPR) repeat protein
LGAARVAGGVALAGCASDAETAADAANRYQMAFQAGDLEGARKHITEAVRARDDVVDYWIALGRVELALRHLGGAYGAYTRAVELDRGNIEALQNLGEISMLAGRVGDAEKHADQVLLLNPQDIRGRLLKGYIALRTKRYPEAVKWADQILTAYPLEDAPLVLKARALFESGHRPEGIELLEKAIPIKGATKPKLETLIEFYSKTGDFAGIDRTFARYLEVEPDNVGVTLKYSSELYRIGRSPRANQLLEGLLKSGAPGPVPERVADVMIEAGGASVGEAEIKRLASGASAPVRLALARVALDKGFSQTAAEMLAPFQGGEMTAARAAAASMYANALYDLGRRGEALAIADRVLEFDEANPRGLRVRAMINLEGGKLDAALRDARVLVRDQPTMAASRLLLAKVTVAREDKALALTTYRQAFNDFPGNEAVLRDYAAFLQAEQGPVAAAELSREFVKSYPFSAQGWEVLLASCRKAGQRACVAEAERVRAGLGSAQNGTPRQG